MPESIRQRLDAIAVLVLRLAVGIVFLAHGSQMLFGAFGGGGLEGSVAVASGAGFQPAKLWGPVLAFSQFAGGLAVLLGFYTRPAAALLMFILSVAILTVHIPMGFFASKGGFEFPLTLFFVSLSILLTGPGVYSLDTWLRLWKESQDGDSEEEDEEPTPEE